MCGKVTNFKDVLPSHIHLPSNLNEPDLLFLMSCVVPFLNESLLVLCNQKTVAEVAVNNLSISPTLVPWD